ncbi:MAG: hypothetical protein JWQ04_2443 [Pedosphaera sp.]|nr:hypothetical protein [Pedosphaera sp.]
MNKISSIRTPHSKVRDSELRTPHSALRTGFTLVELLVVIAIIGLLAGLIAGLAGTATSKMRQSRVEAERDALITAIGRYQKNKGFYPPDNTNDTVQTPLFYELTGTTVIFSSGNPPAPDTFQSPISQESFKVQNMLSDFGIGGFINSSSDPTAVFNFYDSLKTTQHEIIITNGLTFTVLGVQVAGPLEMQPAPGKGGNYLINPWHYNSSHPTNNVDSYDLWMDVKYSGKTNRISNWTKNPVPVSY